jgi:hypothetical protein
LSASEAEAHVIPTSPTYAGGGFLIALGAEKLVSRRIRHAARQLMDDSTPGPAAG